jgi:hypothetical protein
LFGPPAAADDGCEKFAWSLASERAAFAAPDKTTIAAGETLAALPTAALVIRLQAGAQASFEMPPERSRERNSGMAAWCDCLRWQSPASTRSRCPTMPGST